MVTHREFTVDVLGDAVRQEEKFKIEREPCYNITRERDFLMLEVSTSWNAKRCYRGGTRRRCSTGIAVERCKRG
jgi:hypothetical protein